MKNPKLAKYIFCMSDSFCISSERPNAILLIKSVINKAWMPSLYLFLLIVPLQVQHMFCCLEITAFLYTFGLSSQWKSEAASMHFVSWYFIICNNLTGFHKYLSIFAVAKHFKCIACLSWHSTEIFIKRLTTRSCLTHTASGRPCSKLCTDYSAIGIISLDSVNDASCTHQNLSERNCYVYNIYIYIYTPVA